MPRFLLLYCGDVPSSADLPVELHDEIMDRWGEWMERNGVSIVDPGFPFGDRARVGSEREVSPLTGYSVVTADSIEAAKTLCRDHPFLADDESGCVEIFELLPI